MSRLTSRLAYAAPAVVLLTLQAFGAPDHLDAKVPAEPKRVSAPADPSAVLKPLIGDRVSPLDLSRLRLADFGDVDPAR